MRRAAHNQSEVTMRRIRRSLIATVTVVAVMAMSAATASAATAIEYGLIAG
jgi:hypothetical protein